MYAIFSSQTSDRLPPRITPKKRRVWRDAIVWFIFAAISIDFIPFVYQLNTMRPVLNDHFKRLSSSLQAVREPVATCRSGDNWDRSCLLQALTTLPRDTHIVAAAILLSAARDYMIVHPQDVSMRDAAIEVAVAARKDAQRDQAYEDAMHRLRQLQDKWVLPRLFGQSDTHRIAIDTALDSVELQIRAPEAAKAMRDERKQQGTAEGH